MGPLNQTVQSSLTEMHRLHSAGLEKFACHRNGLRMTASSSLKQQYFRHTLLYVSGCMGLDQDKSKVKIKLIVTLCAPRVLHHQFPKHCHATWTFSCARLIPASSFHLDIKDFRRYETSAAWPSTAPPAQKSSSDLGILEVIVKLLTNADCWEYFFLQFSKLSG